MGKQCCSQKPINKPYYEIETREKNNPLLEGMENEQEEAATKIQAAWKGNRVRKQK